MSKKAFTLSLVHTWVGRTAINQLDKGGLDSRSNVGERESSDTLIFIHTGTVAVLVIDRRKINNDLPSPQSFHSPLQSEGSSNERFASVGDRMKWPTCFCVM